MSDKMTASVNGAKQARRYFVSGRVQGVGFRYFTQERAENLRLAGFVRNLRDGRVEAYAIGTDEQLGEFLQALQRGPRGAAVKTVTEEPAQMDVQHEFGFTITRDN
jgi:acylphosphatase